MTRSLTAAAALACGLAGGCIPTQHAARIEASPAKTEAAVARASRTLARSCGLLQAGLAALDVFADHPAIGEAEIVLATVCAAPPRDVPAAAALAARASSALAAAR